MMENLNLNLVNKKGATISTSVELTNKAFASEYFGAWFKNNATPSDVVRWCKEHIAIYKGFIANLNSLMATSRILMVEGMSLDDLKAIMAKKEAEVVPAKA